MMPPTETSKQVDPAINTPAGITPKDAVMAAMQYLKEVTPQPEKITEVRIEELEQIEEGQFWYVVLSYDALGDFPFDKKREYKEFKVGVNDGSVISMKIKKI